MVTPGSFLHHCSPSCGALAMSFRVQVGTQVARNQDGIAARVIEERAFPRQPLTVAQLKGRHLPQPALRFLASLRGAMGGAGQG